MGNIKPSFIKNEAKSLMKEHMPEFTKDFTANKKVVSKYIESNKAMKNKIAGYITRKVSTKDRPQSKLYIQKAIEKRTKTRKRQ